MQIRRILIVEDEFNKIKRIVKVIQKNKISELFIAKNIAAATQKIYEMDFDFLITDLILPRFVGETILKGEKAGFDLMLQLAKHNIQIPTIIYSFSPLSQKEMETLRKVNYPLIAQAMDIAVVERILQEYLS